MSQTRRLAAILAADVAGYSRLMGADEEGTHERLKAHLRELVEPKIREHRGRIVKNTGDGFLAEFASVVDAVRCAVVSPACARLGCRRSEDASRAIHPHRAARSPMLSGGHCLRGPPNYGLPHPPVGPLQSAKG
jgi:class 3 adenylate cyclase